MSGVNPQGLTGSPIEGLTPTHARRTCAAQRPRGVPDAVGSAVGPSATRLTGQVQHLPGAHMVAGRAAAPHAEITQIEVLQRVAQRPVRHP